MGPAKRIGIVGTFDVENFGDLLFPLVAGAELAKRLPGMTLVAYSYHRKAAPEWPYDVRSLDDLARDIESLDLLIVGGGDLVRFDKDVAPGYGPPSLASHHPTAYWLMPTLLAAIHGVPVAWNAVGVVSPLPVWGRPLVALATGGAGYLTVRDDFSHRILLTATDAVVGTVPDTVFGIGALLPDARSPALTHLLAEAGIDVPYVIVQPSPALAPLTEEIGAALAQARAAGRAILELPISPALDDRPALLEPGGKMHRLAAWPSPLLLAELIVNADAIIARSLHLTIVALTRGVPVFRPATSDAHTKYAVVEELDGVGNWNEGAGLIEALRNRSANGRPCDDVATRVRLLAAHWDAIAALTAVPGRPRPMITSRLLALAAETSERADALAGTGDEMTREGRLGEDERSALADAAGEAGAQLEDERILRATAEEQLSAVLATRSWRYTALLRKAVRLRKRASNSR